jgi:hypothetical protein
MEMRETLFYINFTVDEKSSGKIADGLEQSGKSNVIW